MITMFELLGTANVQDEFGNSALYLALKTNDVQCLKLLYKYSVDPDAFDSNGHLPLIECVIGDYEKSFK